MKQSIITNNKGVAAFVALMMMLMLTLVGIAAISVTDDEITIAGNEMNEMASFYAAEAGLEYACAEIQNKYLDSNIAPTTMPAGTHTLNDAISVVYVTNDNGPAQAKTLVTGSFSGLNALVKTYTVSSIGTSLNHGSQMRLEQEFQVALIPIFQWAIFFMEDLLTKPAFNLSIDGLAHVNGSMYLDNSGSGTSTDFLDKVTCSGDIFHGLPSSAGSGSVKFTDAGGNLVSMFQDGDWVDANDADWYELASTYWQGNVRDNSFGQKALNLPLSSGDPHKIIERADGGNQDSYENEATLKIMDGVPYSLMGGVWQDITTFLPAGAITDDSTTVFYDAHEKKYVRNTQIDINILSTSGYFPSNGIIYASDQRSLSTATYGTVVNAASMVNATDIGNSMTLVSENPVYVHGDFNTVNKQPAAAIADAITFLSNNWDPALSGPSYAYTSRSATPTTANISFITGDIAPTGSNYGGGLENLPRFLEDWNRTEFKVRGSMIQGWHSQHAQGTWRYISSSDAYYSAPTRNWGFDPDLEDPSKLPPGTPQVQVFQRNGWKQQNVEFSADYSSGDTI